MVRISPLVQNEIKRLQHRVEIAHRRIERDKNADDEAEVVDRLSSTIDAMRKTGQLQDFIERPVLTKAKKAKK